MFYYPTFLVATNFLLTPLSPMLGTESPNFQAPMIDITQFASVSDEELTQTVKATLLADPELSPLIDHINVNIHQGIVTLNGKVNSLELKSKIEAKVNSIEGVKQVDNQIEVAQ
jgi:osmotically-inducible protein OsmY